MSPAGQILVVGFEGTAPPRPLLKAAAAGEVGGVILFERNVASPAQVWQLLGDLVARAGDLPLLTGVDQEGGRVARLGPPVLPLPAMAQLGAIDDAALTRSAGRALGTHLRALGFSCDFAPVLDVATRPDNPIIGDRAFGTSPETVTTHAGAFAAGLADAGLIACGKHFPGHGDTELDSHVAVPHVRHGRARLDATELSPFRACSGALPMLMTAHVVFEALDAEVPATFSRHIMTDLLRGELGFEGILMSDDLEMQGALATWGVGEAACRAVDAGCDALLICSDLTKATEARDALTRRAEEQSAFGSRLEEAAARFAKLRRASPPRPTASLEALNSALSDDTAHSVERQIARRYAEVQP